MSKVIGNYGVSPANRVVLKLFDVEATGFFEKRRQTKVMGAFIDCPETETYLCRW